MAEISVSGIVAVNGFDLSCYFKSFETSAETDMLDSTTFCTNGSRTFAAGLTERSVSAEGFWAYDSDDDTKSIDKLFNDALSASAEQVVTVANGSSVGSSALLLGAKAATYNVQETVGDLIMINFEGKATNGATIEGMAGTGFGRVLMYQTVTGVVDGTTFDAGSPAFDAGAQALGWSAHVHVTDGDFTTLTVKLQHSTDGNTWTDLESETITADGGYQVLPTLGSSVNRYRRAIVSAFTGTTAKVTVAFARWI